jgi:spoIIIJ-associated protein
MSVSMNADLKTSVVTFLREITGAMGVTLEPEVTETPEGLHVNLSGDGGDILLWQRGEALRALQHIVSTAFRTQLGEERRIVVDCQNFRRDKDTELRQMAKFLVEKARRTGTPQEIGPLNAYERRIVHLSVAEEPGAASESIGDASVKTVIITAR